jgi:hypothetical protein
MFRTVVAFDLSVGDVVKYDDGLVEVTVAMREGPFMHLVLKDPWHTVNIRVNGRQAVRLYPRGDYDAAAENVRVT